MGAARYDWDDLRERGRIGNTLPDDTELALTLIDENIPYPPAAPEAGALAAGG
ncbi:MAG: hypothetical protein OEM05_02360 [Myxococcales bacterium]|nr:hypothetical protein [Myxococcales bacterium]